MTSCRLPRAASWRRYTGSPSSARITSGARSRSSSVSNSGHDVDRETRRLRGEIDEARLARQQQHAQQVLGVARHRDDVGARRRARRSRPGWCASRGRCRARGASPRSRARCAPTSGRRPSSSARSASASSGASPTRAAMSSTRGAMHVGMIAHVHHEAVKAVRAHARDQRIDRRCGRRRTAPAASRLSRTSEQVALERARVRVRGRLARRPHPHRATQRRRRVAAMRAAMKLSLSRTGSSALRLRFASHTSGSSCAIASSDASSSADGGAMLRREGEPFDEVVERAAVAAEDDVARASRGGERGVGRDEGIAVAIAADPVAEAERHGHAQRVRRRAELLLERAHERVARARRSRRAAASRDTRAPCSLRRAPSADRGGPRR